VSPDADPWSPAELETRLRAVGTARYHDKTVDRLRGVFHGLHRKAAGA
jgi:hypothetical protein